MSKNCFTTDKPGNPAPDPEWIGKKEVTGETHHPEAKALSEGEAGTPVPTNSLRELKMKCTGPPDAGNPHVRWDEGEGARFPGPSLLYCLGGS